MPRKPKSFKQKLTKAEVEMKYLDGVEKKQDEQGKFLRNELGEPASPDRLKPSEEYLRKIAPVVAH